MKIEAQNLVKNGHVPVVKFAIPKEFAGKWTRAIMRISTNIASLMGQMTTKWAHLATKSPDLVI